MTVGKAAVNLDTFFNNVVSLPSYSISTDNPYKTANIIECTFPHLQSIDCENTFPALYGLSHLKIIHFTKFVSLENYHYSAPFPETLTTIYVPTALVS